MTILIPLLTGKENTPIFIEEIVKKNDKVILLQIVDKGFLNRTSAAMGEVMQFHGLLNDIKKVLKSKKKEYEEVTEWGNTIQKILSIALLQKVKTVILVKQKNQFFEEIIKALDKEKVKYELVELPVEEKEKGISFFKK